MPTYRSSVTGADRISPTPLGYPWLELDEEEPPQPVETQYEFTKQTADWVLRVVGNDAELAQAALDDEEASETPRTSLITKLQRIVNNAES